MTTVLIIIGAIVLAIAGFVIYRIQKLKRHSKKLSEERFERVKVLYDSLKKGQLLTAADILPYAQNLLTREVAFQLLREHDQTALFPAEYHTLIKGAESNLANWLEFPTELDACPDEIEHIKRVSFDFNGQASVVHYEVFKYRVNEPHWAAEDGWIFGIVGPYFDDSKPYDFPPATFSRVSSTLTKTTAEDEAKWVHENIAMRTLGR